MAILELDQLTERYDELIAVDQHTLNGKDGEFFGLLGPNGAGKTTMLMLLTTLLRPTAGHASVNGFDLVRQPFSVRRTIGIVFQDPSPDDTLSATGTSSARLAVMSSRSSVMRRISTPSALLVS